MHARALHSLVVKKVVMAITGLLLIGFLLMHMFGNLKVFIGPEAYNHYAEWLKQDILYPILPHGWFIWIFRAVIAVSLVLHIYCATKLWQASLRGRGAHDNKKYTKVRRPQQTIAAKVMRWGGLTLLLLLIFHILMFTTQTITFGNFKAGATPYDMFTASFEHWYVWAIYVLFMAAVSLHVRHGFYSAFTTLGANVGPQARVFLNGLAYFAAALIFVGFMLPPTAVLFGLGVS
ncbi:MAG: succinate dehydrogenase cytochrome b subunit [Propionibacteriaceae bacterium]|jgi:succinate dehydrogenase / fumarate reductase cytochrome b subunit|nr:succinate dehydrogenase cytochrome b subunit [Propionibacteriaceae bacterium]